MCVVVVCVYACALCVLCCPCVDMCVVREGMWCVKRVYVDSVSRWGWLFLLFHLSHLTPGSPII